MKCLATLFALLLLLQLPAQQKADIQKYIDQYKAAAVDEMVRSKVPASITLAQGILESAAGTSVLSRNSNNHFGIKCKENWTGEKYYHDDDAPQECFRVYKDVRESYADHSDFLLTRSRYAPLFELPLTSYKYWAFGLKEAGYATNPKYAYMLIGYIEEYKLFELDQAGVAMIEEKEKLLRQPTETNAPVIAKANIHQQPVVAKAETKVIVTEVARPHEKEVAQHHTVVTTEVKTSDAVRQEYTVNGLRAVKAQGNEDPFKIAYEYNIDYSQIMQYNDMNTGDRFKDGEYVYLQNKKARGDQATYNVQAGESMHDIAQKTGVKVRDLYARNMMKMNEQVYAGEAISLQDRKVSPPRTMSYAEFLAQQNRAAAKTPVNTNTASATKQPITISQYNVQQSDTLYSIAKKFNTSVDKLKEINNLESAELKPGQTLVVTR